MKIKLYDCLDDEEREKAKLALIRNVYIHNLEFSEIMHLAHITGEAAILNAVQSITTKLENRYEENRKIYLQD